MRTRLAAQTQGQYYHGILPTLRTIVADEGLIGLYRGLGATLLQVWETDSGGTPGLRGQRTGSSDALLCPQDVSKRDSDSVQLEDMMSLPLQQAASVAV